MGKLIYSAIASLDGYVADERGEFGWSVPDAEIHAFWRAADKIVYSRSLDAFGIQ
jgi:hypothetical protein